MTVSLSMISILVDDYDRGIGHFAALGFKLSQDADLGAGKRWVVMRTEGGSRILLAKATTDEQVAAIGRQTGGRVGFFLETDNFAFTRASMAGNGIKFEEDAREEPYGTVAVFRDGYGNRWDLIEPREAAAL